MIHNILWIGSSHGGVTCGYENPIDQAEVENFRGTHFLRMRTWYAFGTHSGDIGIKNVSYETF
jgi:hypothetical protein